MKLTNDRLNIIFDKTRGKCHLCHKKLTFKNYGSIGVHGSWEIEHSKPKSKGGTDHLNNLFCACIKCNREKGNNNNSCIRSKNGVKKAPLSNENYNKKTLFNTLKGVATGASAGRFFGPGGAVIGGIVGGLIGCNADPDK